MFVTAYNANLIAAVHEGPMVAEAQAPMATSKNWVFWSTPETINREIWSVSAVIESAVALSVFLWFAIYLEIYGLMLVAAAAAPLLLLHCDDSRALALQWFRSWTDNITNDVALPIWLVASSAALLSLIVYVFLVWFHTGSTGWPLFWNGVVPGTLIGTLTWIGAALGARWFAIAVAQYERSYGWQDAFLAPVQELLVLISALGLRGLKRLRVPLGGPAKRLFVWFILHSGFLLTAGGFLLVALPVAFGIVIGVLAGSIVIRIFATVCHLSCCIQALPNNVRRLAVCTSPRHPPELVPGLQGDTPFTYRGLNKWLDSIRDDGNPFILITALLAIQVWFLLAWIYRFMLKSTLWIWWPLAFIGGPAKRAANPEWFHEQVKNTLWGRWSLYLTLPTILFFVIPSVWNSMSGW
jgi:hypothetical protein